MSEKTLQEQFTEFKEQIKVLREKITHTGEQFLLSQLKMTFEKYPQLRQISWTAYTPYFNDGETCEYSSHHRSPELEIDGEDGETARWDSPLYKEIRAELSNFLCQFDSDLMYDLVGDHAKVIITKEGISIEEYEHE